MSAPSRRSPRRAVTASAAIVDLSDPIVLRQQRAARQSWQDMAWTFYRTLPEIRYPANYIGAAMSRFVLRAAIIDPANPTAPPKIPEKDEQTEASRMADDLLLQLEGSQGRAPEIQNRYGVNMAVAADGWLLGQDRRDDDRRYIDWEFLSIRELQFVSVEGEERAFRDTTGSGIGAVSPDSPNILPPDVYARRFWHPHPEFSAQADGPLEALRGDCERLRALNDGITARLLSRLAQAGLLFLPSEITLPSLPDSVDAVEVERGQDPVITKLLAYLEATILNRDSAAGAMPIVLRGPGQVGELIKFITMDRTIDKTEMSLRAELRDNIYSGLMLPKEVGSGMGTGNHWSTWSIMDSTKRDHLQPAADRFADGLTRVYLRPGLTKALDPDGRDRDAAAAEARTVVVVADGSQVIARPNEAEDGRQLHDRIAINDVALRARSGVTESEKPSEVEYVQQLGRKVNDAYLATFEMEVAKRIDWDKVGKTGAEGAPGVGGTPPSRRPADSSDPSGAPGEGEGGGTSDGDVDED